MSTLQNPAFKTAASDWLQTKALLDDLPNKRKQAIQAHQAKLQRYELIKKAVEKDIQGFEDQLIGESLGVR